MSIIYLYDIFCDYNHTEVLAEPASTGEGTLGSSQVHKTNGGVGGADPFLLHWAMLLVCF